MDNPTPAAPPSPAPAPAPAKPGEGKPPEPKPSDPGKEAPKNDGSPPDPNKKIWKLNVYGKPVDFDATDEAAVQKIVQKGLAADRRFSEAAQIEKQLNGLVRALRENPEKVLLNEKLGHSPDALLERIFSALGPKARKAAEAYMSKVVDEELMDPKDREILEHKRKVEQYEAEKKEMANRQMSEKVSQLKQQYQGEYEKDIVETLETSGLPKTPATVKRMAYYMYQGLEQGLRAKDVVDLVKKDYIQEQMDLFGSTDGDALLSILGPEMTKKIVKAATLAAKNGKLNPVGLDEQPNEPSSPQGKKRYISTDEWREKVGI